MHPHTEHSPLLEVIDPAAWFTSREHPLCEEQDQQACPELKELQEQRRKSLRISSYEAAMYGNRFTNRAYLVNI